MWMALWDLDSTLTDFFFFHSVFLFVFFSDGSRLCCEGGIHAFTHREQTSRPLVLFTDQNCLFSTPIDAAPQSFPELFLLCECLMVQTGLHLCSVYSASRVSEPVWTSLAIWAPVAHLLDWNGTRTSIPPNVYELQSCWLLLIFNNHL